MTGLDPVADPPETVREFNILRDTVMSEMKDSLFLLVPPHVAPYYDKDDLISELVIEEFPKASEELRLAGSCFAAGLNTACVSTRCEPPKSASERLGRI